MMKIRRIVSVFLLHKNAAESRYVFASHVQVAIFTCETRRLILAH